MPDDSIFNLEAALDRVEHDRETVQLMVEVFLVHGPTDLAATQAALAAQDAVALSRAAHRLKGALLQVCAPAALAVATRLEAVGNAGDLQAAVDVCATLETELRRLWAVLREVLTKGRAA